MSTQKNVLFDKIKNKFNILTIKCVDSTLPNHIKHSLITRDQLCCNSMMLNLMCLDLHEKYNIPEIFSKMLSLKTCFI